MSHFLASSIKRQTWSTFARIGTISSQIYTLSISQFPYTHYTHFYDQQTQHFSTKFTPSKNLSTMTQLPPINSNTPSTMTHLPPINSNNPYKLSIHTSDAIDLKQHRYQINYTIFPLPFPLFACSDSAFQQYILAAYTMRGLCALYFLPPETFTQLTSSTDPLPAEEELVSNFTSRFCTHIVRNDQILQDKRLQLKAIFTALFTSTPKLSNSANTADQPLSITISDSELEKNTNPTIDLHLHILSTSDKQIDTLLCLLKIPPRTFLAYSTFTTDYLNLPADHVRGVASKIGNNEISFFIPCHRIVQISSPLVRQPPPKSISLSHVGKFRWGSEVKLKFIQNELASD